MLDTILAILLPRFPFWQWSHCCEMSPMFGADVVALYTSAIIL